MESMAGKTVLVIQAHPDDTEFGAAGTVAKWAREGAEMHYCSITSGASGSDDPELTGQKLVALREQEQRNACDILGVKSVVFLGYQDGMVVADKELQRSLVRVMRQIKPDALIIMDPTFRYSKEYINHPDHVAAGEASMSAAFPASGNRGYFPELLEEGLEPHKIKEVFIVLSSQDDTWIDISDTIDLKLDALRAHASQLKDWDPSDMIRKWAKETADRQPEKPEGFGEYAESFFHIKMDG